MWEVGQSCVGVISGVVDTSEMFCGSRGDFDAEMMERSIF